MSGLHAYFRSSGKPSRVVKPHGIHRLLSVLVFGIPDGQSQLAGKGSGQQYSMLLLLLLLTLTSNFSPIPRKGLPILTKFQVFGIAHETGLLIRL